MLYLLLMINITLLLAKSYGEDLIENRTYTNNATENVTHTTRLAVTENPILENLRDIAYYLRAHKFNEYDRRYETKPETAPRAYFKGFPQPPLRSLHWEVRKFCEISFMDCVEFLSKKIKYTDLRRTDDTAVVMQEQGWTMENNSKQVEQVDQECQKMRQKDDILANPFEGPLERFQWRVTASYYMCWYTMQEIPEMGHLNESCDNFAACLHPHFGANNRDPRADDSVSFNCALYSFCPDPCCPYPHTVQLEHCFDVTDNPCFRNNKPGQRKCIFNRTQNMDFRDIVLNRWNVSCSCPFQGFEWNSFFGMCIDVDECASPQTYHCDRHTEACVNLQGGFRCGCQWGYIWNEKERRCYPSATITLIKLDRSKADVKPEEAKSFIQKIKQLFRRSNSNILSGNIYCTILLFILTVI